MRGIRGSLASVPRREAVSITAHCWQEIEFILRSKRSPTRTKSSRSQWPTSTATSIPPSLNNNSRMPQPIPKPTPPPESILCRTKKKSILQRRQPLLLEQEIPRMLHRHQLHRQVFLNTAMLHSKAEEFFLRASHASGPPSEPMPALQPGTSPGCGGSRHCFLNTASGRQVLADFGFEIDFRVDAHVSNFAVEKLYGRKIGGTPVGESCYRDICLPTNAGWRYSECVCCQFRFSSVLGNTHISQRMVSVYQGIRAFQKSSCSLLDADVPFDHTVLWYAVQMVRSGRCEFR